jgi:hypothetical protein
MAGHTAEERIQNQIDRLLSVSSSGDALGDLADRLGDLLQLAKAHRTSGGTRAGRRYGLDALNRAGLVMLTGHFQGFVTDLFVEAWKRKYPGSDPEPALARFGFNNPWPKDIDALFALLGYSKLATTKAEWRQSGSSAGPPDSIAEPAFARERRKHRGYQVLAEMVRLRNRAVHGGRDVTATLNDVTFYLADVVSFAIHIEAAL